MPLKPINTKARLDKLKMLPDEAYYFAKDVIKGRWPEAEPYIMQDDMTAFYYARDVIKGRWPVADSIIMNSEWARDYLNII